MYVLRVVLVIFLNLLAIAESLEAPKLYDALLSDEFTVTNSVTSLDDLISSWFNDSVTLLNTNEEKIPIIESVDCSDMNSKLSGILKSIFAKNINLKKAINVRFYLSSRKQPRRVEVYAGEKFDLKRTDFNVERRTVVIVHGFLSGGAQAWIKQMEDAFLVWGDVNVVVVDWSAVGKTVNYYKAAISTRIVGYKIARFLYRMVNETMNSTSTDQPNWGKLHLIGHSLGSHISGVAAYDFQNMQKHWPVGRITGLDPALPCFDDVDKRFRLDPTDASFVDVIHTSASAKSTVGFGNAEPLGHVDFYPNGGKRQPGCSKVQGSIFDYIKIPMTPVAQGTCSHARSYYFFTESLIQAATGNCTFWGHKWDQSYAGALRVIAETCDTIKCTEMGIRAEKYPHRGIFFVTTSKKSPYCVTDQKSIDEIKRHLRTEYLNAKQEE